MPLLIYFFVAAVIDAAFRRQLLRLPLRMPPPISLLPLFSLSA